MGGGGVSATTATPDGVLIQTVVGTPTVTAGAVVTPDAVVFQCVVDTPAVTCGAVVVATPVVFQTVVPTPTTTSGGRATPDAVVIQTVIVSPTVIAGAVATPSAVVFQVVVPNPTILVTAQQYRALTTVLGARDTFPVVLGMRDEWEPVLGDAMTVPTKNLDMYLGEDRSLPYEINEDLSSISLACTFEDAAGNVVASFTSLSGAIVKETNGSTSTGYVQIDSASTIDLSPGIVTWSIFSNTANDHAEYCNGEMNLLAPRTVL